MNRTCSVVVWSVLAAVVVLSLITTAMSPLLAWREPVYIAAGFAGVVALILLLFQPLLAAGILPGLSAQRGRLNHRWVGAALLLSVLVHVAGLYITSPPDVIDALLFASPTPFSLWGVIAMWAIFATAALAGSRQKLKLKARTWRLSHKTLAVVIVLGSVAHAIMIDGTMETLSKTLLCALVMGATAVSLYRPFRR